jgi:fatty acid desaturase
LPNDTDHCLLRIAMNETNETSVVLVHTDRFGVPAEVREEVRRLSRVSAWRSALAMAGDWLLIAAALAVALWLPHPLVWLAAAVVIATRQHALAVLVHEAAHYRLLRDHAWNDCLADPLLAWPLLFTTDGYRRHHLAHHFHLNTADDPDWVRKHGADWEFPKTRLGLMRLLLRDLCGGGVPEMVRAMRHFRKAARQQATPRRIVVLARLGYYLLAAAAVTLAGLWVEVVLLWFLPLFTLFPTLMRIRSIAEHSALPGRHDLDMTRNVLAPWWERFLFVPHNVHYHLDHHLFPSVPFYRLPELHRLLQQVPDYARHAHQNDSLLGPSSGSVLHDLTGKAASAARVDAPERSRSRRKPRRRRRGRITQRAAGPCARTLEEILS